MAAGSNRPWQFPVGQGEPPDGDDTAREGAATLGMPDLLSETDERPVSAPPLASGGNETGGTVALWDDSALLAGVQGGEGNAGPPGRGGWRASFDQPGGNFAAADGFPSTHLRVAPFQSEPTIVHARSPIPTLDVSPATIRGISGVPDATRISPDPWSFNNDTTGMPSLAGSAHDRAARVTANWNADNDLHRALATATPPVVQSPGADAASMAQFFHDDDDMATPLLSALNPLLAERHGTVNGEPGAGPVYDGEEPPRARRRRRRDGGGGCCSTGTTFRACYSKPGFAASRVYVFVLLVIQSIALSVYLPSLPLFVLAVGGDQWMVGVVFSAVPLGSIIGSSLVGVLGRWFSVRTILLWDQLVFVAANVLYGTASNPYALMGYAFLIGIATGNWGVLQGYISVTSPAHLRMKALALFAMIEAVSYAAGAGVGGLFDLVPDFSIAGFSLHVYNIPAFATLVPTLGTLAYGLCFLKNVEKVDDDDDDDDDDDGSDDGTDDEDDDGYDSGSGEGSSSEYSDVDDPVLKEAYDSIRPGDFDLLDRLTRDAKRKRIGAVLVVVIYCLAATAYCGVQTASIQWATDSFGFTVLINGLLWTGSAIAGIVADLVVSHRCGAAERQAQMLVGTLGVLALAFAMLANWFSTSRVAYMIQFVAGVAVLNVSFTLGELLLATIFSTKVPDNMQSAALYFSLFQGLGFDLGNFAGPLAAMFVYSAVSGFVVYVAATGLAVLMAITAFCSYKALRTEPQYRHRILGRMSKVRSFEDLASLARQSDREGGRNRLAAPPLPAAVAGRRGRRTAVEADRSQVRVGRRWILTPSAPRGHARRREAGGASFPRTHPSPAATATDPLIPGQGADRRRRRRRGRRRHRAYRRKGPNPQGAPAFANASVATKTRRLVRRNSFVV